VAGPEPSWLQGWDDGPLGPGQAGAPQGWDYKHLPLAEQKRTLAQQLHPCRAGGSSSHGIRHTPGVSHATEGNTTACLLLFMTAICKHRNPKAQGQALCVSPGCIWCGRFIQSQPHMKTEPSTKPGPEPLGIPDQGSKPQHQNPPRPTSTPNPLGSHRVSTTGPCSCHHQNTLIPQPDRVFSFVYQQ